MKIPRIFKRSHSIANRLTWRVVGASTLVFTLISFFFFIILWLAGSVLMSALYYAQVNVSNEKINNIFSNVEVALTNNVPEVKENINNTQRQYYAVEHLLQLNPTIVGAAVAYNPAYEPRKGEPFSPYAYRDSLGIHTKQLNTEAYDYLHQEWYTVPLELGKAVWSEPYLDKGGAEIPMITFSLPLTNNNGEVYAIQTADIALDWLADVCQDQDNDLNDNTELFFSNDSATRAFSFIVTQQGTIVAHPDSSMVLTENLIDFNRQYGDGSLTNSTVIQKILNEEERGIHLYFHKNGKIFFIFSANIKRTDWVMAVVVPLRAIIYPVNVLITGMLVVLIIGIIIVLLVCRNSIRHVTKPIRRFADSADEIAKGNFRAELPEIKTEDEMLRLRKSFETMQLSLINQIEETRIINEEKGRMESELQIARNIQMSMLPEVFPPFPDRNDIDIYAQLTPAREVGGDLYDFFIRDEKLFFCIGDVSGKGVPAALVMAVTRALFRTISAHESNPAKIVTNINGTMVEDNDSVMFATLFIGVLDLPTGKFRYSNAGHNSPVLIGDQGIGLLPCDPNVPIGVQRDWRFTPQDTVIDPGTTILLYTDGLTEAENINHEQFNEQGIINVASNSQRQPQQLISHMKQAVDAFVGIAEQSDDLTMLAIQYTKQQLEVRLQRSITLPNDVEQVPQLADFVDEVCEAIGFDMSVTMSLNLALEEAVVNVMTYAYPAGTQGTVTIEAQANEERLKFIISDNGTPFDPTAKEDADTTLSAEERPIGGLGIHLVRQIMDSINYERTNGKNVLTLRKKLV